MLQAVGVTDPAATARRDGERIVYARRESASVAQLMMQHLDLARPGSDAEALRLLRQAFPGAPLTARVEAMAGRAR